MKLNQLKSSNKNQKPKPLYKMERKINFLPMLTFALITSFLVVITLLVFPLMEELLPNMLVDMPQELQEMILSLSGGASFADYFLTQMGQIWGMVTVIYGSYLGYQLVSSNFKGNSSTMLYSLNLSRNQIVKSKLVRLVINNAIFNLALGAVAVLTTLLMGYNEINLLNIAIMTLFMMIAGIQSALLLFGIALFEPKKMSAVLSILIPVVLFFFSTIAYAGNDLLAFAYLSPMGFIVPVADINIVTNGFAAVNYWIAGMWTIIPLVLLVIGLIKFNKKDLI